jgi:hypothetical protein
MSDDVPNACTLDESALAARLAEISALGADSLLAIEGAAAAPVLRFRADDDTRRRLEALVAAERRCCAFLDLTISEGKDCLTLTIIGPEEAAQVVTELMGVLRDEGCRTQCRVT